MTNLEQAEDYRLKALALLVTEKQTIDQKIEQLGGTNGEPIKNGHKKSCSRCGIEGHTIRTCSTPAEKTETPRV